jgi:hypothetical protein
MINNFFFLGPPLAHACTCETFTSEQQNSIVVSRTINENVMDTNLDKIDINQKNKKIIKSITVKTNIHILLNILKVDYENTHQDKPKPTNTAGTVRLQLGVDTRQDLGKQPQHDHQSLPQSHTYSPPPKKSTTDGHPYTPIEYTPP